MAIYCNNCGEENNDSAEFCKACNREIRMKGGTLTPGTMLDKRYEIKKMLKAGGMGAVYEALDHRFDKTLCAVKEMLSLTADPQRQKYFVESFRKEAEILYELKHLNLPGVENYFVEGGRYYLVMEYIEGADLETVMRDYGEGGLPEELVIGWAREILSALDYLHSQSPPIIYRDLKPSNVMLRDVDKRIILVDFGIARSINPESDTIKTVIGTPAFAPQESFEGRSEVRSDIYSLGATMHCLLSGIVPLAPFSFKPGIKPGISEELVSVVMKALAMKPSDRFDSAKEMEKALDGIVIARETPLSPTIKAEIPSFEEEAEYQPTVIRKNVQYYKGEKKINHKKILIPLITVFLFLAAGGVLLKTFFYTKDDRLDKWKENAVFLENHDKYEEAVDQYDRILKVEPENTYILNKKGNDLAKIGKGDEAIKCFDKAIEIDPEYKMSWNDKGLVLYSQKEYDEAVKCYDKALEIDKKDGVIWYNKGLALYKQKEYKKAAECFDEVLRLNPGDRDAEKYRENALNKL